MIGCPCNTLSLKVAKTWTVYFPVHTNTQNANPWGATPITCDCHSSHPRLSTRRAVGRNSSWLLAHTPTTPRALCTRAGVAPDVVLAWNRKSECDGQRRHVLPLW